MSERVSNKSLSEYLEHGGTVPAGQVRGIMRDLLDARIALRASAEAGAKGLTETVSALIERLKSSRDLAYIHYHQACQDPLCLGSIYKLENGKFGVDNFKAHKDAENLIGQHVGIANALQMVIDAFPPPPDSKEAG